jgi:O-antigen/teichoic acid export membrane protein
MQKNSSLRQFATDSSYNLLRQTWSIILGFVTSILLARGLGTEDRGIYAIAVLLPTLVVTLLNSGIGSALVYYLARGEYNLRDALQVGILFSLLIGLMGLILGVITVQLAGELLFPGVNRQILFISLVLVPITLQRNILQMLFLGLQDFRTYNLIGLIPQALILLIVFALVWLLNTGVYGALAALIASDLISLVITVIILYRRIRPLGIFPIAVNRCQLFAVLSFGLRAHLSNIIAFLNYRIDVLILNLLSSKNSVGLYDVAVTLVERLWVLATAVSTVIFPRIAAIQDNTARRDLTVTVSRCVFWISLLMSMIAYALAEWGIIFFYGEDFRDAVVAFRLLLPGIVIGGVSKILANDTAGRGHVNVNAVVAFLGTLVNIIANFVLIPHFDIAGAAIATSISYTVLAISLIAWFCYKTGAKWYEILIPQRKDLERLIRSLRYLLSKITFKIQR